MELDFADVKPSILSWVVVGLMAMTFIVLSKWAISRYPIPGLTEIVNAV